MAATFAAYATRVSEELRVLLDETCVEVDPAVGFVSCGIDADEHFVPESSLERHLRKCHGERRPRPINDAAFYYGRRDGEEDAICHAKGSDDQEEAGDVQGLQSLLEPEVEGRPTADKGVVAAIEKTAASAGAFYEQVQLWRRIPRTFASMKDDERELVAPASLRRWLNAELSRPGILPSGELLDEELVEYVAGLLDHPDFCQPDLLVLELHEFLGSSVTNVVLALWKFLVVEIGLHSVFKMEKGDVVNKIQLSPATSRECATPRAVPEGSQTQASGANSDGDYKRRRASYKGKVGTKTGPAAFREMIQKHMIGLSVEMDRELVLGGGFQDADKKSDGLSITHRNNLEPVDWRSFTDALEVRNRSRPRRADQLPSGRRRSKSRSRSRGRRSSRDTPPAMNNARHSHKRYRSSERKSSERHRRKSRSRSRSRSARHRENKRYSERHQRRRGRPSDSVDRDHRRRDHSR